MGTPARTILTPITTATGPAEPVPVALLARTSTLALQDPVASLSRQVRSCQAWLPPGWYIAGYYWDIESGGIDLEARSQGQAYQQFLQAGIPRDGGMADLLTEAEAPLPRFAAVICEDIERSARDTFNALKLEKKLSRQGIPLFATDEPASIEGINATTVLVRRVKQGVAEWYRLQLKEKAWKGLQEHSLAGWNIGFAPYGYAAVRTPHPAPAKAALGRTKSRLVPDPERGPVVTQIFEWRTAGKLSVRAITGRLAADPAGYPPPDGTRWHPSTVADLLRNPKYTGYMVFGRTRKTGGRAYPVPRDQWIWSPAPVHPALVDRATWDEAQRIGGERGNTRDSETPTSQPGRRYILRSMVRCRICQRRMCGTWRTSSTGTRYVYYRCPHDPANPRHAAAHPDHPRVAVREDALMTALSTEFFDRYVFGHDRAELLAAQIPATAAGQAEARTRQDKHLRAELARIEVAEAGLITELQELGRDTSPAAQAYRARIRARNADLYNERTGIEAKLTELEQAAPPDDDPGLLDQLPVLSRVLADAPDRIKAALLTAFQVQALYNKDMDQVTIWATLTEDTPRTIAALLEDPRTDDDTAAHPTPPAALSQLERTPMGVTPDPRSCLPWPRRSWIPCQQGDCELTAAGLNPS